MSLVVSGTGGDGGKTLVSLGLASAWRRAGVEVSVFKKGPDYIDTAWLSRAAGRPARNLDVWMMGEDAVWRSFARHAAAADVSLVEGNRGLFDGLEGTSSAALSKLLRAHVLLVLDITKMTRTVAAFVAGCRTLDPALRLGGVILNRVGGPRHRDEARSAIETLTRVPVLGSIPRLRGANLLPDRHLGLVPPEEHDRMDEVIERLGAVVAEHVDLERLLDLARAPTPLSTTGADEVAAPWEADEGAPVKVGVFRDSAFTFYYPENLEALRCAGAELVPISALEATRLPALDLLYIGGGFPETHAPVLAQNRALLRSVRRAARAGLPIYAECGGLIYLARSVTYENRRHELAEVLDVDIEVLSRPQGHGYAECVVDRDNPFFDHGAVLRGHEFHYSRVVPGSGTPDTALEVRRGTGVHAGRDGLVKDNVFASWIHLHALGTRDWARALVARARGAASARGGRGGSPSDTANAGKP